MKRCRFERECVFDRFRISDFQSLRIRQFARINDTAVEHRETAVFLKDISGKKQKIYYRTTADVQLRTQPASTIDYFIVN